MNTPNIFLARSWEGYYQIFREKPERSSGNFGCEFFKGGLFFGRTGADFDCAFHTLTTLFPNLMLRSGAGPIKIQMRLSKSDEGNAWLFRSWCGYCHLSSEKPILEKCGSGEMYGHPGGILLGKSTSTIETKSLHFTDLFPHLSLEVGKGPIRCKVRMNKTDSKEEGT